MAVRVFAPPPVDVDIHGFNGKGRPMAYEKEIAAALSAVRKASELCRSVQHELVGDDTLSTTVLSVYFHQCRGVLQMIITSSQLNPP